MNIESIRFRPLPALADVCRSALAHAAAVAWTLVGCLVALSGAQAATSVAGTIAANTTWSASQSPYVVTADVIVDGGATLTIQPGVVIYMSAATNLIVNNGALSALGTSSASITITSDRDVANPNPAPAPGDWGRLQFLAGTVAADTALNNVKVKFGSGIVLIGASPTLNNLAILNQNAPAITLDLNSSPVGAGLVATGNTLNGILVPAGDIAGVVRWALTGIPYVVAQGRVGVGQAALELDPPSLLVKPGDTATLRVALAGPAPAGGVNVSLATSDSAVLSVPAAITIPPGQSTGEVTITAFALGSSSVSATSAGLGSAISNVQVRHPPALSLMPANGTIGIGRSLAVTLTASDPWPIGAGSVALTSSDSAVVSVPATLVIAPGATSIGFTANGLTPGTVTITAHGGAYLDATATLTVPSSVIVLPETFLVAPGVTRALSITLTDPAPAAGLTITLAATNASGATGVSLPASVSVPAGATSATIDVQGIAEAFNTTITASAPGYGAGATSVVVRDIIIGLTVEQRFTPGIPPIFIPQGVTQTYGVKLNVQAPAGGLSVNLATGDSTIAAVTPTSVAFAAGQSLSNSSIAVTGVVKGATTLIASSPGLRSSTGTIEVLDQGILAFSRTAVTVGNGLTTTSPSFVVRLTSGGINNYVTPVSVPVTLTSADSSKVVVVGTPTIPALEASAKIQLSGLEITSVPVAIDASGAGYAAPNPKMNVSVVAPQFVFADPNATIGLDGTRGIGSPRDNFTVCWKVPGSDDPFQVSTTDVTVNLSVTDQSSAGIVAGIYDSATGSNPITQMAIPAGANCSATAYVGSPAAAGSYTITASAPNATSVSPAQTVRNFALEFSVTSVAVGKGLKYWSVSLTRTVDGSPAIGLPFTSVNLVSADPAKVGVPANVIIPDGQSSVRFGIDGKDLTSSPVTIDANAAGYASPAAKLSAIVVESQLRFNYLSGTRALGDGRDVLFVCWYVPDSGLDTQLGNLGTAVTVGITDQQPAGIVDAIYDQNSGGVPITQITIPAGSSCSAPAAYIGSPSATGTYTITASASGIVPIVSPPQTVVRSTLVFWPPTTTEVIVGKRLQARFTIGSLLNGEPDFSSGAITVSLTSSDPTKVSVPATIQIPPGWGFVDFLITGVELTNAPVTITATAPGFAAADGRGVTVVTPTIQLDSLDGSRSLVSPWDAFDVYWQVPQAVGSTSGIDNKWQASAVDIPINIEITNQNPPGIVAGIFDSPDIDHPITQVTIPAGSFGIAGPVYVGPTTATGTYKLSATAPGIASATSPTQTVAASALQFSFDHATVGKGLQTEPYDLTLGVTLNDSRSPITVQLTSSDPSKVSVPANIEIPAGWDSVSVVLTGVDVTNTPVTIQASVAGSPITPATLAVSVVPPQLQFPGLAGMRSLTADRNQFYVGWYVPSDTNSPENQSAPTDTVVALSITDQSPPGIIGALYDAYVGGNSLAQVVIPAGSAYSSSYLYVDQPTATGTYTLSADVAGLPTTVSPVQTVGVPAPQLWDWDDSGNPVERTVVGNGLIATVTAQLIFGGQAVSNAADVVVNLACGDSTVCSVPASVTIPAGWTSIGVPITGLGLGGTTISVAADGYAVGQSFPVSVTSPQLTFPYWVEVIDDTCDSGNVSFYVGTGAAQGVNSVPQAVTSDLTISLSTTLGQIAPSVTLSSGEAQTRTVVQSVPPNTAGTITISAPGYAPVTSRPFTRVPGGGC